MTRTDPTKQALDALAARVAALEAYNVVTDYGNGWHGKPEAGGKVHIWKTFSASGSMGAWGNLYEKTILSGQSYPFTFAEKPDTYVAFNSTSGTAVIMAEYMGGSASGPPNVYGIRPNNTTIDVTITLHAVGVPAG